MLEEDEAALRDVWVAHRDRLWRALFAWSGDPEIASDAIAESFAQAARGVGRIDNLEAWVWHASFKIATGMLATDRRGATVGHHGLLDLPSTVHGLPEDAAALIEALSRLSEENRVVVVLCRVGGWSATEVGRLLDVAPGTVRVRLHRAKAQLEKLMEVDDG